MKPLCELHGTHPETKAWRYRLVARVGSFFLPGHRFNVYTPCAVQAAEDEAQRIMLALLPVPSAAYLN
jgi:hypothetical protein